MASASEACPSNDGIPSRAGDSDLVHSQPPEKNIAGSSEAVRSVRRLIKLNGNNSRGHVTQATDNDEEVPAILGFLKANSTQDSRRQ